MSQSTLNVCHSPRLLFWKCIIGITIYCKKLWHLNNYSLCLWLIEAHSKFPKSHWMTVSDWTYWEGTHNWVGPCIQIKSSTAPKSSSKYKPHSNVMLYTDAIFPGSFSHDLNFHCIYIMERVYICLNFFLLCFWLFWGFFICSILGFLFTSNLEQYSEESLYTYGNLHFKN